MAESKLPVTSWLLAAYQDLTNLKGVSSMKLSRDLKIKQSSAWFILNSAVGARQSSGKLLILNQCLCLESSTMANPFGEALLMNNPLLTD